MTTLQGCSQHAQAVISLLLKEKIRIRIYYSFLLIGTIIINYSGLLTGKYKKGEAAPAGSRLDWASKAQLVMDAMPDKEVVFADPKYWELMACVEKIAKNHSKN